METYRQKLAELLKKGSFTLHELSAEIRIPAKEVQHHLEHVQRSTRPPLRFIMEPARCLKCGFLFKDRKKLGSPGRCPKCKGSHVEDPRYGVGN
ncbi:MAG: hypothetical protein AUJ48_02895 [Deltaproteobacteria bacterium CG1_02_45_11]|nr:MAG: hypothetical protein AUJ48_02895 [Deltaproteobacteria bacterium CG1_02_45_11]